ncbi:MAG: rod shape-determining protein MreC [Nitrospira sp. SB0677_bin_15]|nr:rod shape-determining protein MreC [Nitrospira sp. SB0667_bin_9]MYD30259.1 rod shape-determining protein MreC [Nitrospira sp. SB0661_bin_20]MYG41463.1 rod shape-determining protein MreC [Nitrospira sp. SB0677_bin_15]MYH01121.1 rod shape-determining protein MreC [Nitrospira sp. SB0675_bin_23]MYJ22245.1 rod shape-determining protein MreC [Nitrospira sp. SB0673_bin_12]
MRGRSRPGVFWGSGVMRVSVAVLAIAFVALALLPQQSQFFFHVLGEPLAGLVAVPVKGMATLDRTLREWWMQYIALQGLSQQNRQLRETVQQLNGEVNRLREQAYMAERLASLLEFQEDKSVRTVAARVIGRSVSNWYQGAILNKGEDDGIQEQMGVMTPAGVAGRIVRTSRSASIALLTTDPNLVIAGMIQRTRDEGMVQGTSQGLVRMKYLPPLSSVKTGDAVVTSGLTGGFPRGVLIGEVDHVEESEDGLFRTAQIVPVVQSRHLDEVLIVVSPRSPEAMPSPDHELILPGAQNPTP